ncbi:unnamed protein product [Penicillium bialowiezense]
MEIDKDGIVECEIDTYNQGSYTAVLNEIAVLLWRTQDRLCALGHPSRVSDGERRLYEEIIRADAELRKITDQMPTFFRQHRPQDKALPAHVLQQKEVTQLSLSHKVWISILAVCDRMLTLTIVPEHSPPFSNILFPKPLVLLHKGG